jgi:salicylate hydroxylase
LRATGPIGEGATVAQLHPANRPVKVAIVGAGIGGLAAACALRQRGFEVEVYERAPELGEVGAGVQIGPNSFKVLRALGFDEAVRANAFEPTNRVSLQWNDGSLRSRVKMKGLHEAEYGAPYLTMHRADLHAMLRRPLPEPRVHLGKQCVGAFLSDKGAVARFRDGSEIEADVVVGADGIRSTLREQLFGADAPRFTEMMCWRCMVPMEFVPTRVGPNGAVTLERGEHFAWLGPNGHVICYPIGDGSVLNIFAGRVTATWVEESWSVPSSREELIEAYAGWDEKLLNMFRRVEHCFKWGIFDRDPQPEWVRGRIALLGDAAHPTMPTLAQGANMAIEDGYVLARHLANADGQIEHALRAYMRERMPRTSRITMQSREQFANNRKVPPPPPLDRSWIFSFDATLEPSARAGVGAEA